MLFENFWLFLKVKYFSKKNNQHFLNSKNPSSKFVDYFFSKNIWLSKKVKIFEKHFRKKCPKKFRTRKKYIFCRGKILKFLWNLRTPGNPVNPNFQPNPISWGGWGEDNCQNDTLGTFTARVIHIGYLHRIVHSVL